MTQYEHAEDAAARHRVTIHSRRAGHTICQDGGEWAVIEPNGNIHFDLPTLAVVRAWVDASTEGRKG